MSRTLVSLVLSLAGACPLAAQATPDFSEVRRILREGMARESAPAAAFAVVRDGAIIWEEALGWADSANGRRATPDSPFLLASLNKTFETTLAAVLEQRHRIDLDKPVNEYLATTAISSPAWDVNHISFVYGRGLVPPTPTPRGATDYLGFNGWASVHDLALFAAFHMKAHRPDQRAILTDGGIDSMETITVPTGSGTQRYGLGWWIEDRFGYRTVLSQGGNSGAQAWLRMVPSLEITRLR